MLALIRTKHGDAVHVLPLSDNKFAVLGSNKVYDSSEAIQRFFSRSTKFGIAIYTGIDEIEGGFTAKLIDNEAITVYSFKGMSKEHISGLICSEQNLKLNDDLHEYLSMAVEEVLIAVIPQEGTECLVAVTRVIGGMHHSTLLTFEVEASLSAS